MLEQSSESFGSTRQGAYEALGVAPDVAAKLPLLEGLTSWDSTEPDERRRLEAYDMGAADPWKAPDGIVIEELPARSNPYRSALRIYRPGGKIEGALLWIHGGGFHSGSLDMNESHIVAAETATRANHIVVTVEYRLARGDVHFPAPLQDVLDAWSFTARSFPDLPCSIGGASAGGALALGAALSVTGRPPDAMVLAYPFAHFPVPSLDTATLTAMDSLPALFRFRPTDAEGMVQNYVGRLTDLPALALPGAADLHGLPRTLILACQFDELRPSAELLHRQMTQCHVSNTYAVIHGVPHGHLGQSPALAATDDSLTRIAAFLSPGQLA